MTTRSLSPISLLGAALVAGLLFAPGLLVAAKSAPQPTAAPAAGAQPPAVAPSLAPLPTAAAAAHADKDTRCEACHTEDSWLPAQFPHERTGFPLRGRHERTDCGSCHGKTLAQQVPTSCAACHRDVHAQQFGLICQGCHDEDSWRPRFAVDAHRATSFPLSGRHASLPCEECHGDRRDRQFARVATSCSTCHVSDFARASVRVLDHRRSRLSTSCRDCHTPTAFTPAVLPQHEACFTIGRGVHSGVRCAECHAGSTGLVVTGRCDSTPVSCTSCHEHRCEENAEEHEGVAGYACTNVRCVGCHTR